MDRTGQAWKGMVRNLYQVFQQADEERELVRRIDRSIIDAGAVGARSIEAVFGDTLSDLSHIYGLREPGLCYVYVGPELLLLPSRPETLGRPGRLDTSEVIRSLATERREESLILTKDHTSDGLLDQLTDANTILLHPIYVDPGELFCVLVFADSSLAAGSRLSDPELGYSLSAMAQQLCIAYEHDLGGVQEARTKELWDLFLSSHLAPTRCFHDLAHEVQNSFPTFGPLRLDITPEVQILVLPDIDDPHFLTIRGTTGSEPAITKIDVSDSISGLLVEKSEEELPFFCDDPRKNEYEGRYKRYLGLNRNEPIKTEFAVRLRHPDGRLVGVLNIESAVADAFNLHHRSAVLRFVSRIAPMVDVFEQRITHNRIMHRSVISTTSNYLESLAATFRHGIGTPLLALNLDLSAARRIIQNSESEPVIAGKWDDTAKRLAVMEQQLERVDEVLARLLVVEKQIGGFAEDFAKDISGFSETGRFDVRQLIEDTVTLARRSMLKNEENIKIEVHGEERADAFCSLLLKQHMYSLLTNAIYSLQSQSRGPAPGIINMTLERESPPDESQEQDLNKRWVIRIRDNGGGVDDQQLAQLREFRAETRFRDSPGQGLGLVAVQRYASSIGGWISLNSQSGEFFEVELLLDEYREDIHGPYSTVREGNVDDTRRH